MTERFTICGRIVTHTKRPRFQMQFRPGVGGEWSGFMIPGSLDADASPDAAALARLSREAGEFFAAHLNRDWVQEAVIARAAELQLSAYALAQATGWAVSPDHVLAYLNRKKSMGSHKLQHLLRALGLSVVALEKQP